MIGEVGYLADSNGEIIVNNINDQDEWFTYSSLAELNDEWEDYEEPKGKHWYMTSWGEVWQYGDDPLHEEWRIILGNDFETKEEAEKAVQKLRAWKRLKDKGFRFSDFVYTELCDYARVNIKATMINDNINDDLNLLFGDEE